MLRGDLESCENCVFCDTSLLNLDTMHVDCGYAFAKWSIVMVNAGGARENGGFREDCSIHFF